jgi:hypothetical protein
VIHIYTELSCVPSGSECTVMLCPFHGMNAEHPRDPNRGRYDRYLTIAARLFTMTDLAHADVAIVPADWGDVIRDKASLQCAGELAHRARAAGVPTVVFFANDSDTPVALDDAVVFRTSLSRSSRRLNELALPTWSEDFVTTYLGGQLPLRPKGPKPVVGFCGRVPVFRPVRLTVRQNVARALRGGTRLLKRAVQRTPAADAGIRVRALTALQTCSRVESNVITHDRFFGGAVLPDGGMDYENMPAARRQFLHNLLESDYALCARGAGNFSLRFCEALSLGRIPVFIDTDCVLPFDSTIAWRDYCVWVDARDVDRVGERVAEFHAGLSDARFIELQRECRRLWERFLSPEGFFTEFEAQWSILCPR